MRRFTFGIITNGDKPQAIHTIIESILMHGGPVPEIIVVGGPAEHIPPFCVHVPFDESQKPMWITRKKNLVTEHATRDEVVYMHDYVCLLPGWYQGWLGYGDDYDAAMNQIIRYEGDRFRDWTLFPGYAEGNPGYEKLPFISHLEALLPYDVWSEAIQHYMYFSGTYWVAKRTVMKQLPLNEDLAWGEGEDGDWSERYKARYNFSMNAMSSVRLLKPGKPTIFSACRPETVERLLAL